MPRRITLVGCADRVDLVEQHDRVTHLKPPQSLDDLAVPGVAVVALAAEKLELVPHAAYGKPAILSVGRSGDCVAEGRFPAAWRAGEAENLRGRSSGKGLDRKELHSAALRIGQAVVVGVEPALGVREVDANFALLAPRQGKQRVDIFGAPSL